MAQNLVLEFYPKYIGSGALIKEQYKASPKGAC